MQDGWQRIYFTEKPHLAEIARALLEENDIESVIVDKRDSSYVGVGEVELYVRDHDATLARFLIEQDNL